ncbi:MAG: hypothetical protein COW03_11925 [Cytophagales bacterium CG12_big_fil_rev_8_21_14_0_65_40_12]|nr:MAG: hypothetical protein COW03_11925 [Cytophagales bacterium CG12_big_fil_rev_8_21_14_0_65_40_12]PIW05007.1 MAG: hypothetical protein COW40_07020 [Cytophagales bacterium CG17_big_fil_post_rev_8_21_14_2_50_40_13]
MNSNKALLLLLITLTLLGAYACKPTERNTKKELSIENGAVDSPNVVTMDKDAIRVKGSIDIIEAQSASSNVYVFTVQEVVKYGATFATIEPKIGEKLSLTTPADVRFSEGSIVEIDIKTPLKRIGNLLSVTLVLN